MKPLCFVLMPFGKKLVPSGLTVEFDAVYKNLIYPAIIAAGMEPLRADAEITGGVIHKPMFERLILCDFAVADLTSANANVFYELGLRHGIRPATTVLLSAEAGKLPFDVAPLRTLPYSLEADGKPANADAAAAALTLLLKEALNHHGEPALDSPVFQLVEGYAPPDISHLKTDVFREQAKYASAARETLAAARLAGSDAVRNAAAELGDLGTLESGVVIDIFLSYRATGDWAAMVAAEKSMAEPLRRSTLVQEQLGFALNRLDRRDEAEQVLKALIERHGPNAETNGLLGRVYKDRWETESKAGNGLLARGWLKKAIETYLQGFEADWRDAYPGINAVTLMEVASPPDPRRTALIPIVTYSLKRRIARANPDYWDYATLLELAVLANDQVAAEDALASALVAMRESWELGTTARNLALIANARDRRGENIDWLNAIILSCSTPSIGQS